MVTLFFAGIVARIWQLALLSCFRLAIIRFACSLHVFLVGQIGNGIKSVHVFVWFVPINQINLSKFVSSLKAPNRHHPGNSHLPAVPPPLQLSSSNTDDMNATLLKTPQNNVLKKELFGNFNGFSLRPLPMSKPSIVGASNVAYVHPVTKSVERTEVRDQSCMPIRSAPPPPAALKTISMQQTTASATSDSSTAPFLHNNILKPAPGPPKDVKLFVVKDETKERPKISSPILENSTCTVKELMSPKRELNNSVPSMHAIKNQKTFLMDRAAQLPAVKGIVGTVKHNDTMPKKFTIDKTALKSLEISAPIKTVNFGRSQSMRSPNSETAPPKRMALASASMRRPAGANRPLSIVDRPKNPPPPRPPQPSTSSTEIGHRNDYDDCEMIEEDQNDGSIGNSTDNIYCVIDECKAPASPKNGLLSEIVNEIDKRNLNSIYSTSTKSKGANKVDETQQTYENLSKPIISSSGSNSVPTRAPPTPPPKNIEIAANENIYMNTMNKKQLRPSNGGKFHAIATNASRIAPLSSVAKSKPTIASKPIGSISASNSLACDRKNSKESSQVTDLKKTLTKNNSIAGRRPSTTNSTSSSTVKSLHKKFENAAAAAASTAKPKK